MIRPEDIFPTMDDTDRRDPDPRDHRSNPTPTNGTTMSGYLPISYEIVDEVDQYIYRELSDSLKYQNRSLLDESGIASLHQLVAKVYAQGFHDGCSVQYHRNAASRLRQEQREEYEVASDDH